MNRFALLIAHPGEKGDDDFLEVESDIQAWTRHLLSPLGGNWSENEILILRSPCVADLDAALRRWQGGADYALIVFSGHGAYSETLDDTILQINSKEEYHSKRLHLAKKETIVLDCCRKVIERLLLKSLVLESLTASQADEFPNPQLARIAFNRAVGKCPDQTLILHSCDIDEFAYDDAYGRGGAYTHALLTAAGRWRPEAKLATNQYTSLSAVSAHNRAAADLLKNPQNRQNPKIGKPRSGPYLPLSVWV
jgi:hypothetical protein